MLIPLSILLVTMVVLAIDILTHDPVLDKYWDPFTKDDVYKES